MRFGVLLLSAQFPGRTHTRVLDATVAAAVTADEDAGFEDVWIAEHHFMSYGVCPSAITLAGYLLGATRRIAVGTAVSVLTVQHPIALPEQALLTRSPVAGPPRRRSRRAVDRPQVFGTGHDRYDSGLPETLDLLLAGLRGGPVHAAGPLFRFPEVTMVPGPRSRPRPEVVVAATTTGTVELAARRRLPLLLGMYADDDEKAAMVRHYAAVAGGRHSWLGPGLVGYRRADTDSLTAPATPTTTPNCCAASIPSAHIPSAQPSGAATGWPAPPAAPASGT